MWLKIYCLLCGYKHQIVRQTSERFQKYVRKNFAALLILMILWYFTGYLFTLNHVKYENNFLPHLSGIIMMLIVVFVERQIMLSEVNKKMSFIRIGLGFAMALIGSFVIDQAIFNNDIDNYKKIDPAFTKKNEERKNIEIEELKDNILFYSQKKGTDSLRLEKVFNRDSYKKNHDIDYDQYIDEEGNIQSFKTKSSYNQFVDEQRLKEMSELKDSIASSNREILIIRGKIRKVKLRAVSEALENSGFLENLVYFKKFLLEKENRPALIFYIVVLLFLLFLELLILSNKWGYKPTDYDALLEYQEKVIIDQFN